MQKSLPQKLENKNFKKMLVGTGKYLPKEVTDELKAAGMKSLLHSKEVRKDQALQAVKHLQEKNIISAISSPLILKNHNIISKFKAPSEIYHEAAVQQRETNELARLEKIKERGRVLIKVDLSREAWDEMKFKKGHRQNQHTDSGNALGQRNIDESQYAEYEDPLEKSDKRFSFSRALKDDAEKKKKKDKNDPGEIKKRPIIELDI